MVTNGAADRHEVGSAKWLWDGLGGARALWEGSLAFAEILEIFLLKWTHLPQDPHRVQKAQMCFSSTHIVKYKCSCTAWVLHAPWCALHGACRQNFRDVWDQGVTCNFFSFLSVLPSWDIFLLTI